MPAAATEPEPEPARWEPTWWKPTGHRAQLILSVLMTSAVWIVIIFLVMFLFGPREVSGAIKAVVVPCSCSCI